MAEDDTGKGSNSGGASSSSMGSRLSLEVEKFNGKNNFGMWKCEVKDVLTAQDLDHVLEAKPKDISDDVWKRLNKKVCGIIRNCLARELKYLVMEEESAANMWNTLQDKYNTKSIENRLYLICKLYRFRMKRGVDMAEHLNGFTKLLADLANVDEEVKDEVKACVLLNSLPSEYESFVNSMIYGKKELKYDDVSSALSNHEFRKLDLDQTRDEDDSAVLVTRFRGKSGKGGVKSRGRHQLADDECAFCHEKGHWKNDCPKMRKTKKNSSEVNLAQTDGGSKDDSSEFLMLAAQKDYSTSCSKWVFDSGATFHVCTDRAAFSSYRKVKGQSVRLGNGMACRVMGKGSIELKLEDGQTKELKGVRYVPAMTCNLISLGMLGSEGKSVRMERNSLVVLSAGGVTELVGHKVGNMYYLLEQSDGLFGRKNLAKFRLFGDQKSCIGTRLAPCSTKSRLVWRVKEPHLVGCL